MNSPAHTLCVTYHPSTAGESEPEIMREYALSAHPPLPRMGESVMIEGFTYTVTSILHHIDVVDGVAYVDVGMVEK